MHLGLVSCVIAGKAAPLLDSHRIRHLGITRKTLYRKIEKYNIVTSG
jgi:hypothetical protein